MSGTRPKSLPAKVLRGVARAAVTVAVLAYTLLDELLFPLFRPLIAKLSRLRLFQRLGELIGRLPPYGVLLLFGVPFAVLEPAKVFAVYWAASGHVVQGTVLLVGAHVLSLLVCERIFHAGYAALMRIGWFKRLLDWLFGLRDRAIAWARSTAAWQAAAELVRSLRAWLRGVTGSPR